MFDYSKKNKALMFLVLLLTIIGLSGCKDKDKVEITEKVSSEGSAIRDNTPIVLEAVAGGEIVYGNDSIKIDATNASEGYLMIEYLGDSNKVKMQIQNQETANYTYDLADGTTCIPLTGGSGDYHIAIYENIDGTQYSFLFEDTLTFSIENEYGPYLYPNQRVSFTKNSDAVAIGMDLAKEATCDIEVVYAVYEYVYNNITYDHDKAENIKSGYLPDVDVTLHEKKGICYDYAALMAAMLRSQRIPTRLEIGYAGDAYHAWISVYIVDIGWINGMIEFDGLDWSLMDPTFAANTSDSKLKKFIGDGSNYTSVFVY